jgi:Integrase core domain
MDRRRAFVKPGLQNQRFSGRPELFASLAHVREALMIWKNDYNLVRPHSAIGNLAPSIYAELFAFVSTCQSAQQIIALSTSLLHHAISMMSAWSTIFSLSARYVGAMSE